MLSIVWSVLPTRNTLSCRNSTLTLSRRNVYTTIVIFLTRPNFTDDYCNFTLTSCTREAVAITYCAPTIREIMAAATVFLRHLNISKLLPSHQPAILRIKNYTYLTHFLIITGMIIMVGFIIMSIINYRILNIYMS